MARGRKDDLERALSGMAEVHRLKGWGLEGVACMQAAVAKLREMAAADPGANAYRLLGRLIIHQGVFQTSLGRYAESRVLLQEGLAMARTAGDRLYEAHALDHLGEVFYGLGEFAGAEDCNQKALEIYRQEGNRRGMASVLSNLGLLAFARRRYPEAKRYHEQSLAMQRELGNELGVATTLGNLANTVFYMNEFAETARLHEEVLSIANRIGNRRLAGATLLNGDFITIDGTQGGADSGREVTINNTCVPLIYAVPRANRYLSERGVRDEIDLIVTGGLRDAGDFMKAMALGANAVYIGESALLP